MVKKTQHTRSAKRGAGPSLTINLQDAGGRPLVDNATVEIVSVQTNTVEWRWPNAPTQQRFVRRLKKGEYRVTVTPLQHRRVRAIQMVSRDRTLSVRCPIDPKYAVPTFPTYTELKPALKRVLERSKLTRLGDPMGEQLYDGLKDRREAKAGLFNLFAKMQKTLVGDRTTWSYVNDVYRVQGDRIFTRVAPEFLEVVDDAVPDTFEQVDGSLHTPDAGFHEVRSFKTPDKFGNLQLTFFASDTTPIEYRVDADIDNSSGLRHAFDVVEHWTTGEGTNPYDIHQLLVRHQQVYPLYALGVKKAGVDRVVGDADA